MRRLIALVREWMRNRRWIWVHPEDVFVLQHDQTIYFADGPERVESELVTFRVKKTCRVIVDRVTVDGDRVVVIRFNRKDLLKEALSA